ncbi:MAG: hypothetical protein RLZZ175_1950 [Bacteroidota bacterium]
MFSVFVISTCGLIYELVAGTVASYLLGDSVFQFSTIIGVYLFSMGLGSYFSKFIKSNIIQMFVKVELLIGFVGGFGSVLLFLLFEKLTHFELYLYANVSITGILVGLEIPLLMRLLKDKFTFDDLVSEIFTFDYIGALLASLLFPLVFVPYLGILRTSLFFGFINVVIAFWVIKSFKSELVRESKELFIQTYILGLALLLTFVFATNIQKFADQLIHGENIVVAKSSPYQRIVVSKDKSLYKLYLNGNLQFSSDDEYRYHEALVHPCIGAGNVSDSVFILGGGDGFAVRELLKYDNIKQVTLVDLDKEVTKLFKENPLLSRLNHHALRSPKLTIINTDAYKWVGDKAPKISKLIIDFPDPSTYAVGKLYSLSFYQKLYKTLTPGGTMVIQCTSPFFAPKSYWCINKTLQEAGFFTMPYHTYVPSFGEWGFILASKSPIAMPVINEKIPLKYLSNKHFKAMLDFSKDMTTADSLEVNRLNNQSLVHYFEKEWSRYAQ